MIVSNIQSALSDYKNWLKKQSQHPHVHWWESVAHFQQHWNTDTDDPAAMFEGSFYNAVTRRMWQTENWQPKAMMHLFWQYAPTTVRLMFDDLFNETREVEGRIGRFLFGCDELLRDYRRDHPTSIENNHYHADFQMISIYLAFRYPETYAPYDLDTFRACMTRLGAKDIPQQHDLTRYFKVLRTLTTFMDKDPEIQSAMQRHLNPRRHYTGKTMLLTADFCRFAAL